jgi:hypothetical protein
MYARMRINSSEEPVLPIRIQTNIFQTDDKDNGSYSTVSIISIHISILNTCYINAKSFLTVSILAITPQTL